MRNPRHGNLAFLSAVLRVIGILLIIAGFCHAAVYFALQYKTAPSLMELVVGTVGRLMRSLLTGVLAMAVAQAFLVLLDIEESVRRTADAVEGKKTVPTPRME
ncbi:MAG: hypothetical protein N2Z21_10925 [Candidatus Sumerlaeaceae bacterium]|nr:hypothetical protein [Candidatus Sumerlaeaceae bacterium]